MRIRDPLSMLLLASCVAGCISPKGYPPGGSTEDSWHYYVRRDLALYGEKPLDPESGTQVYRFVLRPANAFAAMVRIEHSGGRTIFVGKRYGMRRDPLELSGELSAEQWELFLTKIYETEFWLSDTFEEQAYARDQLPRELELVEPWGLTYGDAEYWFLEASNGSRYHIGSEEGPTGGVIYELGTLMMDLAGISWLE